MNIAIDYDDTYTKDWMLWDVLIEKAFVRGHNVHLVTWRDGNNEGMVCEVITSLGRDFPRENIHFTNLKAKRKYMEDKGIYIDVWIDDNPYAILHDGDVCYMQNRKIEKEKNASS